MKHTPGPWFADGTDVWNSRDIGGTWIADCPDAIVAVGKANARLIAAAPELLAACELATRTVLDMVLEFGDKRDKLALEALYDAIKKARGQ